MCDLVAAGKVLRGLSRAAEFFGKGYHLLDQNVDRLSYEEQLFRHFFLDQAM